MIIAIDIRAMAHPTPSGVGQMVAALVPELVAQAPEHTFVLFTTGRMRYVLPNALAQAPNVQLVQPRGPSKCWNLAITLGRSLERLLGVKPDCVWYPNTGFLPRTRARMILHVHDLAFLLMPSTYRLVDHLRYRLTRARTWMRRADQCIAVSHTTARDLHTVLQRDATVIPHGVDHTQFTPALTPEEENPRTHDRLVEPFFLFLATREPRKNLQTLFEAWTAYRAQGGIAQLVIAGQPGWKQRTLDRRLRARAAAGDLQLLDYVPNAHRAVLLRGAWALLLPSRYEGFGMQLLEAMACHTPVVTSANSSLLEVAQTAAISVPAMNVARWQQALHALEDAELRCYLADQGARHASTANWTRSAHMLLQELTRI